MAEDDSRKLGNYTLLNVIAQGGSTQIWEATDGQQSWAIKVLLPEKLADAEERSNLKHEITVLKALEHPSFIRYRDSEVSKKASYIVMEYFRSPNLKSQIASDLLGVQTRMPKFLEQICLALGFMHEKGWLHRDLKPDNILLSKTGELRLIDFSLASKYKTGLAKILSGKLKAIQGTRTYIAPETILKQQPSPQTDMYSLGITLYECLTGRTPFTGLSPQDLLKKHIAEKPLDPVYLNDNLTPDANQLIQRLLSKKPADRYASMNEMYAEVRSMKLFKVDPVELIEQKRVAASAVREAATYEQLLDSRADADRTTAGVKLAPRNRKPQTVISTSMENAPPTSKPSTPPAPNPAASAGPPPGYALPPGYVPQPPGQMPYPMPQYPPPGYGYPPVMPPGYPQWPAAPYPMPQPGVPGQPGPAPVAPVPASPASPPPQGSAPAAPAPPAPAKPAPAPPAPAKPAPPPKKPGEDLPLMDELPDVI